MEEALEREVDWSSCPKGGRCGGRGGGGRGREGMEEFEVGKERGLRRVYDLALQGSWSSCQSRVEVLLECNP